MNDGIGLIFIVVLGGITAVASFSVIRALFPGAVENTRSIVENTTGRAFLIGLVNLLFLGAVSVGFFALGENLGFQLLALPALLIMAFLAVGTTIGFTSLVPLVGERLFPEHEEFQRIIRGGAMLLLACLAPYVGWFGLLPYVAVLGLGAFILGSLQRLRSGQKSQPEEA
jgi:hypothetical protein